MSLTQTPQRIVIAGGPGSGKSTLLQALADAGEVCYEECSRLLIREQLAIDGALVPWADLPAFAQECGKRMRKQLTDSVRHRRCFFDRGLPDLKRFLALTARRLCESCLYVEVAGSAVLLYSAEDEDLEVDPCLAGPAADEEPSSAL